MMLKRKGFNSKFKKLSKKALTVHVNLFTIIVCSTPPSIPAGASANPSISSTFLIGETITYTCNDSAFAISDNIARCQSDASWIPTSIMNCEQFGISNW